MASICTRTRPSDGGSCYAVGMVAGPVTRKLRRISAVGWVFKSYSLGKVTGQFQRAR
jgi:hypothetical protein